MTVQIIAVTVRSITVERMNNDRYESTPCTVLLNGKTVKETALNVISIFGLDPDTGYELEAASGGCRDGRRDDHGRVLCKG